ncbi:SCO4402 family protein [Mesorhizobium comanense]|uniref:SCO4402 family protein n=1 Tax=Mesorhizobium comanense TaxID=2502215 RepID=UPI0010F62C4A|nr:hypothetical protein [Mesorhizobium comanense]
MSKELTATYKRAEIRHTLTCLSDVDYQQACWIERRCPPGREHDRLRLHLGFLLNDNDFTEDPKAEIGVSVYSEEEALAIQKVAQWLYIIVANDGHYAKDEVHLHSEEWHHVVSTSKAALNLMNKHESD